MGDQVILDSDNIYNIKSILSEVTYTDTPYSKVQKPLVI